MRHGTASLILVLAVVGAPAIAAAALQAAGTPNVEFVATGPMGLRIAGATHDLTVEDDGTSIKVHVPLGRLTTGIGLRDRHLLDHLDVRHFPAADLTVPRGALRIPTNQPVTATVRGTIRIHGRERPINFRYTATPQRSGIAVVAATRVDMTQFGLEQPSYLGVTVAKEVNIAARFAVREH